MFFNGNILEDILQQIKGFLSSDQNHWGCSIVNI